MAIDRVTRWVFVPIKPNKSARSATEFLQALHEACPIRIQRLLTDNGKEFTDRLFASREREPSGKHPFDKRCAALGIEHRLTQPHHPQTNGMVERFNGRIADVLAIHHFDSAQSLSGTLLRYATLYNQQFPQSVLKGRTPRQVMQQCYDERPDLFIRKPDNQAEFDNYTIKLAQGTCDNSAWKQAFPLT